MARFTIPTKMKPKPESKKTKTYCFTDVSLAVHDDEVRKEAVRDTSLKVNALYLVIVLYALHSHRRGGLELGWGTKRLQKAFHEIEYYYDAIAQKRVSYVDLYNELIDDCDIKIQVSKPNGGVVEAADIYEAVEQGRGWSFRLDADERKGDI